MAYQSRAWCFTLNNPVRDDIPNDWFMAKDVVFVTWQKEIGANGTPHLQGYLITKVNDKSKAGFTMKWCKENITPKAHFEMRRGTHRQAKDYANKEDTRVAGPWTLGEWKDQETTRAEAGERAKKVNLLDIKAAIDAGATDEQLWQSQFGSMMRYSKAFANYRAAKGFGKRKQPAIMCFWGEPGCGKSQRARAVAEKYGEAYWWNADNGNWFDLYDTARHQVVVLDDFNGTIKYTTLLRMLDCYPLQLEIKGAMVAFNPAVIIITSNKPPNQWYFADKINFDHGALLRRLDAPYGKTIEMKKSPNFVQPAALKPFDFDSIENGTFLDREAAARSQYLGDVSKAESRKAVIDLTKEDGELEDEKEEWKIEVPIGGQTDLERDWDADMDDFNRGSPQPSQAVSTLSALGRTDVASLAFNTPLNKAGSFKKLGPEPVQSVLSFKPPRALQAAPQAESRKLKFHSNDDDGEPEEEELPRHSKRSRRGQSAIKVRVQDPDFDED